MTRTSAVAIPGRRGRRRAVVAAAGAAAVGLALAGCSYLSPAQVVERYPQADGTWAELHDPGTGARLRLEDMLLVAEKSNAPGTLIGAISSDGDSEITVALSLVPAAPASSGQEAQLTPIGLVKVPAHGHVTFGPEGEQLGVASVPVPPGATVTLHAAVSSGETVQFSAPVQRPQGIYEGVSPSAPTTATPSTLTTSPGASTSGTVSPSGSTSGPEPTTSS